MTSPSSRVAARVAIAAAVISAAACQGTSPTLRHGDTAAFEQRLEQLRVENSIPGMAAAVAKGNRIVWQQGFGYADVEHQVPATPRTSFHLASLTKPFAATALMRLVQDGEVSLDAPVSTFGIDLTGSGTVRVRHLLSHTSEGEAGDRFRYDGDRFSQLDRVMLAASGRSVAELLVNRIIRPLRLTHTAPNPTTRDDFRLTGYDYSQFSANMAVGYTSDGTSRQAYPSSFTSAAGLVSSVEDVIRFSRALDDAELVSRATWLQMAAPTRSNSGERLPYGLGWFVQDVGGVRLIWHYGFWTANSSLIVKVPAQGLTFVLLANSDMLSKPYMLAGGDVLGSPYASAFAEAFVGGN